jgi:SAM-dependent MidA family methyltransferase
VALIIDYGPAEPAYGDTLQAVRHHAYVDPLRHPGHADLTAHVQFASLARKAREAGLAADSPISQAEFLGRLGAAERAARLMAANPERAGSIEAGVQRLMSPTGMGGLFKVMGVRSRSLPPPPPFV